MKLTLIRKEFTSVSTISDLLIDGEFYSYVLEDVVRPAGEAKVYGKTAIPFGSYKVIVDMSNRFKRRLPLLVDVPGFAGIRIHSGNTAEHTDGCLLPGSTKGKDFVGNSRATFEPLLQRMEAALHAGEKITIDIVDGRKPAASTLPLGTKMAGNDADLTGWA